MGLLKHRKFNNYVLPKLTVDLLPLCVTAGLLTMFPLVMVL